MTTVNNTDLAVISSDKVEGASVYNADGHKLGSIDDLMIDKWSGQVRYAVLEFGGFLGMGTRYVAVDADSVKIKYDMSDKKWHANMNASKDELKNAPEFKYEGEWNASKS